MARLPGSQRMAGLGVFVIGLFLAVTVVLSWHQLQLTRSFVNSTIPRANRLACIQL